MLDTISLRMILYFSHRKMFDVLLYFLYVRFRFLISLLIWQVIQGCSLGLMVTILLGIVCSAAVIIASEMQSMFSLILCV